MQQLVLIQIRGAPSSLSCLIYTPSNQSILRNPHQEDGWIDEATRALALEISLHSFSARKLMYVRILVELPAEGGVPLTHPLYNTFNTFNSFEVLRGMVAGNNVDAVWSELGSDGGGLLGDRCEL